MVENLRRDLRQESEAPTVAIRLQTNSDHSYGRHYRCPILAAVPLEAFEAHVSDAARLLEAVRSSCTETPLLYVATGKNFG
jgi:hypothetical protein